MPYTYITPYRRGGGSLLDLHKQMNQMFDDLLGQQGRDGVKKDKGEKGDKGGLTTWPSLEIEQDDKRITIHAELAGLRREDVEISMDDGMLTLSGEKKQKKQGENGYSEFSYGRFERQVSIPSSVDLENAQAEFDNGLLTITLPKVEEQARGKKIEIRDAGGQGRNRSEQNLIEGDGKGKDKDKKSEKDKQDA